MSKKKKAAGNGQPKKKVDFPLLDSIKSPADLRDLPLEDLPYLAEEIRQEIIHVVSSTGGTPGRQPGGLWN